MWESLFKSSHHRRHHYCPKVRGEDAYYDSYRTWPTENIPFRMNGPARRRWREEERTIRRLKRERQKEVDDVLTSRRMAYDEYRAKKPSRSLYSRDELDTKPCPPALGGYGSHGYEDCVSDYPLSSPSSRSHYSSSHYSTSDTINLLSPGRPRKYKHGLDSYLSCVKDYPKEEPAAYRTYKRLDGYF